MATAAAHGLSSFSSYQCAAAVKAVSSAVHAVVATHMVAVITAVTLAVVITPAVAESKT